MMSLDLNLLNVLLIVIIIYLVYPLIFPAQSAINHSDPDSYNYYPSNHPQVLLWRRYTPSELSIYDGTNPKGEGKILLAIRKGSEGERTVFDVTAGKSFYGPDGPYGNFAGRDASRGMAKQSFDEDMLTPLDQPLDDLKDLEKSDIDNMTGWHDHFTRKYIVCGELVEEVLLKED